MAEPGCARRSLPTLQTRLLSRSGIGARWGLSNQAVTSKSIKTLATIRVLACVIEHHGRFLVGRRPTHKRHGGLWEFPGGKVELGESDFAAVERELEEELGVSVCEVGPVLYSVADPGSRFLVEFLAVSIDGEPRCIEHTELAWVTEEEFLLLPLAPSDLQFCRFRRDAPGGASAWRS